jgi:hypothetical protein
MADALARVGAIDPNACRAHVQAHFSPAVAATGYLQCFERATAAAGNAASARG